MRHHSTRRYSAKLNRDLPPVPKTTTRDEPGDFKDYCERIQRWCAMGGDEEETEVWHLQLVEPIYIPDPNQYDYDEF
jgi:hypothetical protein